MSEEKKEWNDESVERSLSKMASSFYKMQLGVNSIRDELRTLVDLKNSELETKNKETGEDKE